MEFDGNWLATVKIPTDYNDQVEGLCSDYDGNPDNDLTTKGGVDVSGENDGDSVFGGSWQVDDPTDPQ